MQAIKEQQIKAYEGNNLVNLTDLTFLYTFASQLPYETGNQSINVPGREFIDNFYETLFPTIIDYEEKYKNWRDVNLELCLDDPIFTDATKEKIKKLLKLMREMDPIIRTAFQ